jgi:hypothetical protein
MYLDYLEDGGRRLPSHTVYSYYTKIAAFQKVVILTPGVYVLLGTSETCMYISKFIL